MKRRSLALILLLTACSSTTAAPKRTESVHVYWTVGSGPDDTPESIWSELAFEQLSGHCTRPTALGVILTLRFHSDDLSFVVPPDPEPDWGTLLTQTREYLCSNPPATSSTSPAPSTSSVEPIAAYIRLKTVELTLYTHCGIWPFEDDGNWYGLISPTNTESGPPQGFGNPSQSGTADFFSDGSVHFRTGTGLEATFQQLDKKPFIPGCD